MSRVNELAARFERSVSGLDACCTRIENQFAKGRIRITDVEQIYSGCFLSVHSRWETFLEETLYETVCGGKERDFRKGKKMVFRNRKDFRSTLEYVHGPYLSIGAVERAIKLAEVFVQNGRPISAISELNRTRITEGVRIRNAIAHDSRDARRKFREKVPGVAQLPKNRRVPGAFLRHSFRRNPSQMRYEIYFAAYRSASREIGRAW